MEETAEAMARIFRDTDVKITITFPKGEATDPEIRDNFGGINMIRSYALTRAIAKNYRMAAEEVPESREKDFLMFYMEQILKAIYEGGSI